MEKSQNSMPQLCACACQPAERDMSLCDREYYKSALFASQVRGREEVLVMSSRRTGVFAKCCLVAFAVASALFVSWPALNWSLSKGFKWGAANAAPCGPCVCDCPPPLSLLNIVPGLVNLSITDCGKHDSDLNKEMEKQFVDLLTEELQLQKAVAEEHTHHMNLTYIEARRLASQYQKEAEKCNAATETCEEARERVEASLIKEKRVTALWERRARKLGYEGE